jgi:hypothetical protein
MVEIKVKPIFDLGIIVFNTISQHINTLPQIHSYSQKQVLIGTKREDKTFKQMVRGSFP